MTVEVCFLYGSLEYPASRSVTGTLYSKFLLNGEIDKQIDR
jgi:hypothetical protein